MSTKETKTDTENSEARRQTMRKLYNKADRLSETLGRTHTKKGKESVKVRKSKRERDRGNS